MGVHFYGVIDINMSIIFDDDAVDVTLSNGDCANSEAMIMFVARAHHAGNMSSI